MMKRIFMIILPFAFPLAFFCKIAELTEADDQKKVDVLDKAITTISIPVVALCFFTLTTLLMKDLVGWPDEFNPGYNSTNISLFLLAFLIMFLCFEQGSIIGRIEKEKRVAEAERRLKAEVGRRLINTLYDRKSRLYWQNVSRDIWSIF
ncbi:MAG: hypothetical protein WCV59_04660 [Parcubacteria group bacterium]|jgi:hypothetical protein